MKILLVAPENLTTLGVIAGYCKKALESMGHEVSVFDFRSHPYSRGRIVSAIRSVVRLVLPSLPSPYDLTMVKSAVDLKINQELIERASNYKPDLLLVFMGENISLDSLRKIRSMGLPTANWIFDSLLLAHSKKIVSAMRSDYDRIFIIDSQDVLADLGLDGANISTLALACNPDVHRRINLSDSERKEYRSDIAFVGTVTPEREKILSRLGDFDLKIWGRWPRREPSIKDKYRKKDIYAAEAAKIYRAAKIILDFHTLYGREEKIYNVTPRVFEVPASGGFVLTNDIPQLSSFYKVGEEIIVYKSIDDLRSLIKYYLLHEDKREEIARRAYARAHREHTYRNRLETLLKVALKDSLTPKTYAI